MDFAHLPLLFHKLLKCINKFTDDLVFSLTQIPHDTSLHMPAYQFAVKGVDSRIDRSRLCEYIRTIRVVFEHFPNAANLSFYAV